MRFFALVCLIAMLSYTQVFADELWDQGVTEGDKAKLTQSLQAGYVPSNEEINQAAVTFAQNGHFEALNWLNRGAHRLGERVSGTTLQEILMDAAQRQDQNVPSIILGAFSSSMPRALGANYAPQPFRMRLQQMSPDFMARFIFASAQSGNPNYFDFITRNFRASLRNCIPKTLSPDGVAGYLGLQSFEEVRCVEDHSTRTLLRKIFFNAAASGHNSLLDFLLVHHVDMVNRPEILQTALQMAEAAGHTETQSFLAQILTQRAQSSIATRNSTESSRERPLSQQALGVFEARYPSLAGLRK